MLRNVPHVNVGYKYDEVDVVTLCNVPHVNVTINIMREML